MTDSTDMLPHRSVCLGCLCNPCQCDHTFHDERCETCGHFKRSDCECLGEYERDNE